MPKESAVVAPVTRRSLRNFLWMTVGVKYSTGYYYVAVWGKLAKPSGLVTFCPRQRGNFLQGRRTWNFLTSGGRGISGVLEIIWGAV